MKPVQFGQPASEELAEAVRRYEMRRPGLGADFFDAIVKVINLQDFPKRASTIGDGRPRFERADPIFGIGCVGL